MNLHVNVSDLHGFNTIINVLPCMQSLSCPLEALSTLTAQLFLCPSLERASLPLPVTLNSSPVAGSKTIPLEELLEGGEDQTGTAYSKQVILVHQTDFT